MTAWLRQQGEPVNHNRVGRIMRQMGIQAIYPKPTFSPCLRYIFTRVIMSFRSTELE
jgi:transposase InsO family protein